MNATKGKKLRIVNEGGRALGKPGRRFRVEVYERRDGKLWWYPVARDLTYSAAVGVIEDNRRARLRNLRKCSASRDNLAH